MQCVRLEWLDDALSIAASDLEAWISESIAGTTGDPWKGCVDARHLDKFVRSLPKNSEARLTAADDTTLTIAAGGAAARFGVLPADEFPAVIARPSDEKISCELAVADMVAALRFCLPAVGDQEARFYLSGIYFDPAGIAVATDGHRLARHRLAGLQVPEGGVIVPTASAEALVNLLRTTGKVVTLSAEKRVLTVASTGWSFTTKLIDGTFPDYRRVLPPRSEFPVIVDRNELKLAAERVVDLADAKTKELKLSLAEGALAATGGELNANVRTVLSGVGGPPEARVALNARYLVQAVASLGSDQVELHLGHEPHTPMWVCAPGETEDGIVIVPMTASRWERSDWPGRDAPAGQTSPRHMTSENQPYRSQTAS